MNTETLLRHAGMGLGKAKLILI